MRRTDFEQFGYTDNCPGCANAGAGRKQAVDHSEHCRSRMETILSTTTVGHERLERARDRFAQVAKELDIALRAKGGNLLRLPVKAAAVAVASATATRTTATCKTEFGTRDRNDWCNRRTTGRVKETKGASRSASSCEQQQQQQ